MQMTSCGLVRTTLLSSTAGLMLGVPLLSFAPAGVRGEEPRPTPVVRAQSEVDGGIISRWRGNRTESVEQSQPASSDLPDEQTLAAADRTGFFGRLLGSSDPNSPQMSRQVTRAQQKFFKRNPQMMQMMMMQQQLLLLQEQQKLQQSYEEEAIPDSDTFESLEIDPLEWSDAPGGEITEKLPNEPSTKPWWETGETPVNSRRRRAIDEDEQSEAPADEAPEPAAAEPEEFTQIPDLFTADSDPLPAESALIDSAPAEFPTAPAAPVLVDDAPVLSPETEDFDLTFPEEQPRVATVPQPSTPATQPAAEEFPAATEAVENSPPVVTPPQTAEVDSSPADFIPPAPTEAIKPPTANAALESPVTPPSIVEEPFFGPAAAHEATIPAAPAAPQRASSPPEAGDGEPRLAAPIEDEFFPAVPDVAEANEPAGEPPAFPSLDSESIPSGAAPFIPDMPAGEAPVTPAVVSEQPSAPIEPPAANGDSPFTGLKLDDPPMVPAVGIPSEGSAAPQMPAIEEPEPAYQFPPERTVAVPNPAPFIPPEPQEFGGTYGNRVPQPAPAPGQFAEPELAPPSVADSEFSADEYLAPDVSNWIPDPMQAPDPIVAPSTARQLVATPPPSPQETRSKIDRIAARKGLSGLKGFCPVALKDHRELMDARPEFSAVYNGRRYFFSSAAAQSLFENSPEEYAPAALGNDVVHLMITGEASPGSLEHAVWFRSKLYLFASAETMETFVAAPSIHSRNE